MREKNSLNFCTKDSQFASQAMQVLEVILHSNELTSNKRARVACLFLTVPVNRQAIQIGNESSPECPCHNVRGTICINF